MCVCVCVCVCACACACACVRVCVCVCVCVCACVCVRPVQHEPGQATADVRGLSHCFALQLHSELLARDCISWEHATDLLESAW